MNRALHLVKRLIWEDYMGRTHHTNVDTFDHLHRDDLMRSSVVLATFIWHAATRDEMMPRKPLPTEPPAN